MGSSLGWELGRSHSGTCGTLTCTISNTPSHIKTRNFAFLWTGSPSPIDLVGWFHWVSSLAVDAGLLGAVVSTIVATRLAPGAHNGGHVPQQPRGGHEGLCLRLHDNLRTTSGRGQLAKRRQLRRDFAEGWKSLVGHRHDWARPY